MKKMMLTALVAAFVAGPALAETVRMGTEGAYPPYNFINDKGEVDGFERELGDELCSRAKLDCVWVVNEWDSIIPNLVSGNYDTIIAGMSITAGPAPRLKAQNSSWPSWLRPKLRTSPRAARSACAPRDSAGWARRRATARR